MAIDTNSQNSKAVAADYEAITEHLAELRKDVSKLPSSVGFAVNSERQNMAHDVSEGITKAAQYVGRKGRHMGRRSRDAEVEFESVISNNPFIALALAVGAGLLIGAMTRR